MPMIQANGVQLGYDLTGSGTPIIFISGISLDRNVWAGVTPSFGDYQVVTFDNRDVGVSSKVPCCYTAGDMAGDVIGLMRELDLPAAHVVGHSLGGVIAQEVVLAAPERVRSLVLIDTIAKNDAYTAGVLDLWKIFADRLEDPEEFSRGLLYFGVGRNVIAAAGVQTLVDAFQSPNPQPRDAFKRQVDAALTADTTGRAGTITAPTLVTWGDVDTLFPAGHSRQLVELLPNATGVEIPGAGHSPLVEMPEAFVGAVREFITAH